MSAYESVRRSIYSDPTFEALSLEASSLYLWSFINPLCNWSGLYVVSKRRMEECKVPARRIDRTLSELHAADLLYRNEDMIWVRSRIKYLYTRGHKIAQGILRELVLVDPRHPLRVALIFHYGEQHAGEYPWLAPVLKTLDVVPHSADDKVPQPTEKEKEQRVFGESQKSALLLVGSVSEVSSSSPQTPEERQDLLAEFDLWLVDHEAVTGMVPPKRATAARAEAWAMFVARRREDYSLDDLKFATRGAFNDQHRRDNGYYGLVSVLRPTKVHDLIEKGRRGKVTPITAHQRLEEMRRRATEPEDAA